MEMVSKPCHMPGQLKYPILVHSKIEKRKKILVAKWGPPKKYLKKQCTIHRSI